MGRHLCPLRPWARRGEASLDVWSRRGRPCLCVVAARERTWLRGSVHGVLESAVNVFSRGYSLWVHAGLKRQLISGHVPVLFLSSFLFSFARLQRPVERHLRVLSGAVRQWER